MMLRFADSEYLGPADRADALSGRFAVLHRDRFGVLDLPLGLTLDTVSLHGPPPLAERIHAHAEPVNGHVRIWP